MQCVKDRSTHRYPLSLITITITITINGQTIVCQGDILPIAPSVDVEIAGQFWPNWRCCTIIKRQKRGNIRGDARVNVNNIMYLSRRWYLVHLLHFPCVLVFFFFPRHNSPQTHQPPPHYSNWSKPTSELHATMFESMSVLAYWCLLLCVLEGSVGSAREKNSEYLSCRE